MELAGAYLFWVWLLALSPGVIDAVSSLQWSEPNSINTGPSNRYESALAATQTNVYVFGGQQFDRKDDFWKYTIELEGWTDLSAITPKPSARDAHAMAAYSGDVFLFSGSGDDFEYFQDFWKFDVTENTWQDMSIPSFGSLPSGRTDHAMAVLDDKLFIYGGWDSGGSSNAFFEYRFSSNAWFDHTASAGAASDSFPWYRRHHVLSAWDGKVYVHGGYVSGEGSNDELWAYDTSGDTWTKLSSTGGPASRQNHGMVAIAGQLIVFGGSASAVFSDVFAFSIADGTWSDLSAKSSGDSYTARDAFGYGSYGNSIFVFGCDTCSSGPSFIRADVSTTDTPGDPGPTAGGTTSSIGDSQGGHTTSSIQTTALPVQTTPAPAEWTLEATMTLVGVTAADFDSAARETFKEAVASAVSPPKAASDVRILRVQDKTLRRLLAAALEVDLAVDNFASSAQLQAASSAFSSEATQQQLLSALQESEQLTSLISITSTVDGKSTTAYEVATTTPAPGDDGGVSIELIVGGIVGVVLLAGASFAVFKCVQKRKAANTKVMSNAGLESGQNKLPPNKNDGRADGGAAPGKVEREARPAVVVTHGVKPSASQPSTVPLVQDPKYAARTLILGGSDVATLGLNEALGLDDEVLGHKLQLGVTAIKDEFLTHGDEVDRENLRYCLQGKACDPDGIPPHVQRQIAEGAYHGGALAAGEYDEGHAGMTLDDFVHHEASRTAKLERHHVLALRLYTTSSYPRFNNPLRSQQRPHPFAMSVKHLAEALRKLRTVRARSDPRKFTETVTLWRGMKDMDLDYERLESEGGTEMAAMSTTTDKNVALAYAASHSPLLFKYEVSGMAVGVNIQYLSVYPKEVEYLYPPLTFIQAAPGRPYQEGNATVYPVIPTMA